MIAQTTSRFAQPATARTESRRRDAAVTARMADFMIRHTASNGSVDRDDLLLEFSPAEITANFESAKAAARRAGRTRVGAGR